jgi:phosphate-selective porin OprO/OprP
MHKHNLLLVLLLLSFVQGGAKAEEGWKGGRDSTLFFAASGGVSQGQVPWDGVARVSDGDQREVVVSTQGGLEIATTDGEFSLQLGGRIMADAAYYCEDRNRLGNGTELRSIRIGLEGRLFADYVYEFDVDFAGGESDVKDAWVGYDAYSSWQFKVGQFKEPFSLEELTSRKYITFMERALPNALVPGRNMGLGMRWQGERVTVAAGLFGEDYNDDPDNEGDEGWGATVRATFAPVARKRSVLHFGVAASHRRTGDAAVYRVDVRPESHLTDIRYLDTGKINESRSVALLGLETAWVDGPWSLQSEWMRADLDRNGQPDPGFVGWYLLGSWFLTGESRNYKRKKGAFGRVRPLESMGAVELALRYSRLDLNDLDVEGGLSKQVTLGLNWYMNSQMRLMANYIWVQNDHLANADGEVAGEDEPRILQVRAQVDF